MRPLLEEYQKKYPNIALFLRGDSGFDMDYVSSSTLIVYANRVMIHA